MGRRSKKSTLWGDLVWWAQTPRRVRKWSAKRSRARATALRDKNRQIAQRAKDKQTIVQEKAVQAARREARRKAVREARERRIAEADRRARERQVRVVAVTSYQPIPATPAPRPAVRPAAGTQTAVATRSAVPATACGARTEDGTPCQILVGPDGKCAIADHRPVRRRQRA
jgi:hypothetical protein